ncbi:hypothetical protein [Paenibacillus pini]|uniref:Uncharacterized protein n=1 Tax=Paenibacillus pini JCM 16418 TaxID=1236976 RepID=W7YNR1_9BACL|nr:hypothetical protein [Paenibacillus pini]GAF06291.1 hypothetical protein JCM16418_242 [Paenibacillus pini JCM 16418]
MIIASSQINTTDNDLYCNQCQKEAANVNLWWTDGVNDDGLGYCEVHVDCATCDQEILQKSAVGEVDNVEEAIEILESM